MRTTPKVAQLAELMRSKVRPASLAELTTDQDKVLIKRLRAGAFAPARSVFVFARGAASLSPSRARPASPFLPEKTQEVGECHAL